MSRDPVPASAWPPLSSSSCSRCPVLAAWAGLALGPPPATSLQCLHGRDHSDQCGHTEIRRHWHWICHMLGTSEPHIVGGCHDPVCRWRPCPAQATPMLLRFLQTEFHLEIEEEEEVRIVRWLGRRSGGVTCSRASNQEHRIRNKETNLKYWTSKSL